jgi:hypothetical protein
MSTELLFDPARGSGLEVVDAVEAKLLIARGALVRDARRTRPRYFDGRFLTAADLTADQAWTLTRQAELGRLLGAGVVEGLDVEPEGTNGTKLRVRKGTALAASGEVVTLMDDLVLDLADIPTMQRLGAVFDLETPPHASPAALDGLHVLVLRPVEYTAFPVGTYPTDPTGSRPPIDGEIVEGTLATLAPFPDAGDRKSRRARAARRIFAQGQGPALPPASVAVALVSVEDGLIAWIDVHAVRRELGADQAGLLGFHLTRRAAHQAFLLQHLEHLRGLSPMPGTATEALHALPPIGILPAAAVDGAALTQRWFPPELRVSLTVIPADELAALTDERLLLPPIDLLADKSVLSSLTVDVLVPVPRASYAATVSTLDRAGRALLQTKVSRGWSAINPVEKMLLLRRQRGLVVDEAPPSPEQASPWAEVLAGRSELVYAVRPAFSAVDSALAERLVVPRELPADPVDPPPVDPPPTLVDTDQDGLPDDLERQLGTDPTSRDTDRDRLDDLEEVVLRTDPTRADTDGDGLSDGEERKLRLDPLNPDTDAGGVSDGREVEAGLDPTDPRDDARLIDRERRDLLTSLESRLRAGRFADNDALQPLLEAERTTAEAEPAEAIKVRADGWAHRGAGEGLLAALRNTPKLSDADTQRRLAATGLAGTLDRLLTTLPAAGRKTARDLLESWTEGRVDDAQLALDTAKLAAGRTG